MKEKPSMSEFFKKKFIKIKPQISPGICPYCEEVSSFISIVNDIHRCMACGLDVEQKINGVIKYLPIGQDKIMEHESKEG